MLKKLQEIGLKEKEALVYIELLKLGTQPASVVARRIGIPKSTGNFNLEMLVKKGFATKAKKGTAFLYTAEDPNVIIEMLNYEKRKNAKEIDNRITSLNSVVTELKSIQFGNVQKPEITFYEGEEGLVKLYESILSVNKPIDSFEDKGDMVELIPDYVEEYIKKRIKKKLFNRVISPSDNPNNTSVKSGFREGRFIDKAKYPFTGDIKITGDCVGICSFQKGNVVGIMVKHKDIANNFRIIFEELWKRLDN